MDLYGWTRDLQAVVDYLVGLKSTDVSRLYLVGFSGGAAVSVYVGSQDKRITGIVGCACPAHFGLFTGSGEPEAIIERYRSIGAIRDADFPPTVAGWFDDMKKITPLDYVAGIAPRPLLLVHGSADETVPVDHAHQLYERAGEPKELAIIDGAGHRLRQEDRAVSAFLDWIKSLAHVH
jgi:fermentation-respiration switch protein FrsA (DUF1100 family)